MGLDERILLKSADFYQLRIGIIHPEFLSCAAGDDPKLFSVAYQYDQTEFSWTLQYSAQIDDTTFRKIPDSISYAVYNSETLSFVSPWQQAPKAMLRKATLRIGRTKTGACLPTP
jgi:hypothetical protein